jgi:hypothetical protein
MSQAPIPSNMEGDRRGSPYAWYNTAFNPRLLASQAMMSALPMGAGVVDRMTGSRIQGFTDRVAGATLARNQQDTNAYMRQLMRNDPGNQQYSVGQRIRSWARGLFGGDDNEGGGPAPIPSMAQFNPYSPTAPVYGSNQGMMGSFGFNQFVPSMAPQPLYGTGQGMMRTQPAPLYGTGQGMMRAPEGGGGEGGGSSGGGGASSGGGGGGGSSIGERIASHGWATRVR